MPDIKERAWAPFELSEAKADGDAGVVEGYASIFGDRDHGRDRVIPGAFKKSLAERGQHIVYIPSHDYGVHVMNIPAVPIKVEEDNKGLHTVTQFFLNTQAGRDSFEVIKQYQKAGRPLGLSYTFHATDVDYTKDGRDLKALDLYEYGHTALPMLDSARTTSAKADGNYMMHSTEIDHAHAHGDTIHSHPHVHDSDSYSGMSHSSHDHTPDQMKSLGMLGQTSARYTEEQIAEMTKAGETMEDGSVPIHDEEDLKTAIHSWDGKPEVKAYVVIRAKALKLESLIPDSWSRGGPAIIYVAELKSEALLAEFETKLGKEVAQGTQKKIRDALENLQALLEQPDESETDPQAKTRQEIDDFLEKITL